MFVVRSSAVSIRPSTASRATLSRPAVVARSSPPGTNPQAKEGARIDAEMAQAMRDAENCQTAGECAAAWDNVEEISAHMSHQKVKQSDKDPLDVFCEGNPDADECRVYED
eukprot:gene31686-6891_t